MADLENNFNSNDFSLISPAGNQVGDFGKPRDYVKLTIRDQGNSIVNYDNNGVIEPAIFYSSLPSAGDFIIQTTGPVSGSANRDYVISSTTANDFVVYENSENPKKIITHGGGRDVIDALEKKLEITEMMAQIDFRLVEGGGEALQLDAMTASICAKFS